MKMPNKPLLSPIEGRTKHPTRILKQWHRVLQVAKIWPINDRIPVAEFNRNINSSFDYKEEDLDYWLTPSEFTSNMAGDCEDFAIFKFFKLPYPRYIAIGSLDTREFHAVLVIYAAEFGQWAVLDNMTDKIVSWQEYLAKFKPVYLCDAEGVYI